MRVRQKLAEVTALQLRPMGSAAELGTSVSSSVLPVVSCTLIYKFFFSLMKRVRKVSSLRYNLDKRS
jgi:uncharacterized membrane protein